MTLEQALPALKPYCSKIPTEELNFIRDNWGEAEPVLLAEIDRCIASPLDEDHSALLFYALYLRAGTDVRTSWRLK